jgi:hypothetical protein
VLSLVPPCGPQWKNLGWLELEARSWVQKWIAIKEKYEVPENIPKRQDAWNWLNALDLRQRSS